MENESTLELVTPALDATSFVLDGIEYRSTGSLSIARYKVFQKRSVEFGYDSTFKGILASLDEAWTNLNENRLGRAAQVLGNLRDGISRNGENRLMGLEVISLFYNSPDEDPKEYNHSQMLAKMERWEKGGLAAGWLFTNAARQVSGFYEAFQPSQEQ